MKALCDAVGLECIIALSEANPEQGVRYRHTWNVLTIDGKRYHMDATFDNSLQRGVRRYDYYNLDDRHIFSTTRSWCCRCRPARRTRGTFTALFL